MGMEYAAGISYRVLRAVLGGMPFHVYLAGFISFWSSLSIGAAFLAGRALWASSAAGLLCAAALALTPASFARTPGNFLREDFTLPLLFFSFALAVVALKRAESPARVAPRPGKDPAASEVDRGNRRWQDRLPDALAAGLLAVGVATWHLSRFYVLVLVLLIATVSVLVAAGASRIGSRAYGEETAIRRLLATLLVGLALAGIMAPVLREKRFLLSPAFLVGLSFLACLWLSRRAGRRQPLGPPALAIGIVAACAIGLFLSRALPGAEREYAHTTGLLLEKLRFIGQKPADPSLLSEDARVFWVGPFATPSVETMLLTFSTALLWGIAAMAFAARDAVRRRLDSAQLLTLLAAGVFAASALLVERLGVFFVFFASLLVPILPLSAGESRRRALWILLALLALIEIASLGGPERPTPWRTWITAHLPSTPADPVPNLGNNRRVVAWVRRHVPERAAVLTWFPAGPMVLTDTARPINLHSMFESSALRAKERRMRAALYAEEEDLYAVCREWESDYLLYSANLLLDTTSDSYRYMADRMRLASSSAAVLLHFYPERLQHFTLVYQDSYYRLFRVRAEDGNVRKGDEGDRERGPGSEASGPSEETAPPLPYEEIFDPAPLGALGEIYPDEKTSEVLARQAARLAEVERGIAAEASGRPDEAYRIYHRLLQRSPDAVEAEIRLALLLLGSGQGAEADSVIARALVTRPEHAELRYTRGLVLERLGRRDEAVAAYKEALALEPAAHPARERLRALGED